MPVSAVTATTPASTRPSMAVSSSLARSSGPYAWMTRTAAAAMYTPRAPAIAARAMPSASNWRTMRPGVAPNVARIAISRVRLTARASDSPATFAAATSSTQNTAPASSHSASRGVSPTMKRLSGMTLAPSMRSPAGTSRIQRPGDRADFSFPPVRRSRPDASGPRRTTNPRCALSGAPPSPETACAAPRRPRRGPRRPGGRTPMISEAAPSSTRYAPMASREPPNRSCQNS